MTTAAPEWMVTTGNIKLFVWMRTALGESLVLAIPLISARGGKAGLFAVPVGTDPNTEGPGENLMTMTKEGAGIRKRVLTALLELEESDWDQLANLEDMTAGANIKSFGNTNIQDVGSLIPRASMLLEKLKSSP